MTLPIRRFERLRRFLALVVVLMLPFGHHARAEDAAQTGTAELANPFSDFVPFEDENDVDEDERFMYFGKFFGVSLGSGVDTFGGNIGKLYNTALPIMDFRLVYFFDFRLAGNIGVSSQSHAFLANLGSVEVNMLRINADLKYYLNTKETAAGITMMSPYIIGGLSQTFRSQTFDQLNQVAKDTALAVSGGAGIEFALKPRKISLGLEARYYEFFFKDRYQQTYAPDGIPDLTGPMYSFMSHVTFFF